MYVRTIICLANSRKPPSGRCIAGRELNNGRAGAWLRPVSNRPGHEVSEVERRYQNGTTAQLLDIVRIPLTQPAPMGHQVENQLLDDQYYWVKEGVATWEQVVAAVDAPDPAFWGHLDSTFHGVNDKVRDENVGRLGRSLQLIRVNDLTIKVRVEAGYQGRDGRRRVRASFTAMGNRFCLSATDPVIEERYLAQQDGEYHVGDAVVCVSVSEVWQDYAYAFRLAASIITPERCAEAAARP